MFELFTEQAVVAIMRGQEESRRVQHNFMGTEQILLGLFGAPNLKAIFGGFGVTYADVRRETDNIIGRGTGSSEEIPFTPRGKLTLIFARDAAEKHQHSYIAPVHLLVGVNLAEGVASRVLKILGVNVSDLELAVEKEFGPPSDDFAEVFYPAKAAEKEQLKGNVVEMRIKFEKATADGQDEIAADALKRLKAYEWLLSFHK